MDRLMPHPFDHGELNIPLAKRQKGYLARLEREATAHSKAEDRRLHALRAVDKAKTKEALRIIAGLSDDRLRALGAPHGLTIAQTRLKLESSARRWPDAALKALSKEAA
jgi:hypothetical protein